MPCLGGRFCGPVQTAGKTSRSPLYIIGFVILFATTTLVLISFSTNNWQITSTTIRKTTYYTSGLWFSCKNVYVSWYNNRTDIFCNAILSSSEPWLIACDIFYTIGTLILILMFLVSILGFCTDIGNYTAAIPSLIQWGVASSTICQLITVSVYGGKGIGNYTLYEPGFSLIIAAISTGLSTLCMILFILETECGSNKRLIKGYSSQ